MATPNQQNQQLQQVRNLKRRPIQANKFALVSQFKGYIERQDVTNVPSNYLIKGSQNVVSTDGLHIANRKGYTLFGAANPTSSPILSWYDWYDHRGQGGIDWHLRSSDDVGLEVYFNGAWRRIDHSDLTSFNISFTEFWLKTDMKKVMVMVCGDNNLYMWSGGMGTFASCTTNTITKEGSNTWGEDGFLVSGTRKVLINGVEYAYTGGENTTTLTGVTPDPSGAGISVGDVISQKIVVTSNKPFSSTLWTNDIVSTMRNQLYVGSTKSLSVYCSVVGDYTDYTAPSVPRVVGDSAELDLDASPIAFVVQEQDMYITCKKGQWYKIVFTLSSDLTSETLTVDRLKTGPQQNAIGRNAVFSSKNDVLFVSQEKTFDTLGRVERITTPQSRPLSYPVKLLFERLDLSNASGIYWNNFIYIALPAESVVLIYNVIEGFWESPQILPIVGFSIIDGDLYGHSNSVSETYKMNDGYNDNGVPIESIAKFAYQNGGSRVGQKIFNEWYTEGYITSNTTLNLTILYEYEGAAGVKSWALTNKNITLFEPVQDGSLGKNSLGKANLGGTLDETDESLPPKFRDITPVVPNPRFFEICPIYSSDDIDQHWEILCFGPNEFDSGTQATYIKK